MADNPLSLSLKARVKILEQENMDLKRQLQILSKMIPDSSFIDVSDEQSICEVEIKRIRDITFQRPLSLDETKKLDILVKNLKSIRESEKEKIIEVKKNIDTSLDRLIEMVNDGDGQEQNTSETGSDS